MALVVAGRGNVGRRRRATIEGWLKELCPNIKVNPRNGKVTYEGEMTSTGCCCLKYLIDSKRMATIHPLRGSLSQVPGLPRGTKIRHVGGGSTTRPPGSEVQEDGKSGIGADPTVYLDASNNSGKGYYVFDPAGEPISEPPFLILAHELCTGHAYHNIRGTALRTSSKREQQAIDHENAIRRSIPGEGSKPKYSQREGHSSGWVGDRRVRRPAEAPDRR